MLNFAQFRVLMLRTTADAEMLSKIDGKYDKSQLLVEPMTLKSYIHNNLQALDFVIEHADINEKDLILFLNEAIVSLNVDAAKIILKRTDISKLALRNIYTLYNLYNEDRAQNILCFALSLGLDPNACNFSSMLSTPLYTIVSMYRDLAAFCELIAAGLDIKNDRHLFEAVENLTLQAEKYRDTPKYPDIIQLLGFFKAARNEKIDVTNQPRLNRLTKLL